MAWVLLLLSGLALADELSHTYEVDEAVTVWFNKVTPRHNPQETYAFSSLPLCRGDSSSPERTYALGLGEAIEGFEMQDSRMDIRFLREAKQRRLCSVQLSASDSLRLREGVREQFWLQLFLDDLPVWGPLGKEVGSEDGKGLGFVYTHLSLLVYYNDKQIIQVLYQPDELVQLESPDEAMDEQALSFYYSVTWLPTSTPFEARLNVYKDPGFFESNVHWFSILNSFVMVFLMCGIVGLILSRTLSKDYAQYEKQEQEMDTLGAVISDSAGWKQISGEVFRAPSYLLLFTVCMGAGAQLLAVALSMLLLCLFYPVYTERGRMTSLLLVMYSVFAVLGGIRSGSFYLQQRGRNWIKAMLVSLLAVPFVVTVVVLSLSVHAALHSSSAVLPLFSLVEVLGLFLFVAVPLHVEGTILGRSYLADAKYPCQVSMVRQPILRQKRWFQKPLNQILLGGLLPFGSISVETYFIFSSFWNYKLYYVYGFGLGAFLLLLATLSCVAIVATYFLLCAEDYRWPWVSFLTAGSTAGYLFLYAVYYYVCKSSMSGWLQWSLYFGYVGLVSFCLFLLCGAVGHFAAYQFVRLVYTRAKRE